MNDAERADCMAELNIELAVADKALRQAGALLRAAGYKPDGRSGRRIVDALTAVWDVVAVVDKDGTVRTMTLRESLGGGR